MATLKGSPYNDVQRGRGGQAGPPAAAQAAAAIDLTGYWVSVVTEDWRYRMVIPAKGDHPSVPLNAGGVRVAATWDPDKDTAAGEQCKAYGAAGVMRMPGRLHIAWNDPNTLRIDTEAGMQTRLLHFGGSVSGEPTWQGYSAAPALGGGDLKVVTTRMRPGYLQPNGVPYSQDTVLTEYFNRSIEPNGDSWLILTSIVQDPQNLNGRFFRSTHFKKLPDGAAWKPTPCRTS
ncbi:MAG: hypothetical protein DMF96_04740 [Acidobacteria bacterium]|nr:MAG: hypothetical protein DMF96_04740 [Acidobacteriota bacterium]